MTSEETEMTTTDAAPGTLPPGTAIPTLPEPEAPQVAGRACISCGADLTGRHPNARKCATCSPPEKPRPGRKRNRPSRAAAPRASAPAGGRRDAAPPRPKVRLGAQVTASIETLATVLQTMGAVGSETLGYDGRVLMANASDLGALVEDLASKDPRVAAALERMFTVGSWGKVGMVVAATAVPILANHGVVPVGLAALFAPSKVGMPPARPVATAGRNGGARPDATAGRNGGARPDATAGRNARGPVPPVVTHVNQRPQWTGAQPPADVQAVSGAHSHPDLPGWPADQPLPWEVDPAVVGA